jgi:ankyrin repeat protein
MFRTLKFPLFEYKQKFDHDAQVNHNLVLEVIMKSGADPNSERSDEMLRYPVFYALKENDMMKASILADHGLNTGLKNVIKQTPL